MAYQPQYNPQSVIGSVFTYPQANQSVSGTVNIGTIPGSIIAFQAGPAISSVINSTPSSLLTGASIFGQLPGGTAVLGSVATLQGTNPWIVNFANSSVLSVPVGSTIVYLQAPSIVGTYSEDAGHTSADKGLFVLGVRNDATSSFVSANLDYAPHASDSAGRTITKPFSSEDGTMISYTGSVVSASVTLIQSSAIGLRSYITDFLVTNTGSVAQLVTFQGGDTSVLGYTIAPAGGGSNAVGWNIPMKTTTSQDLAFRVTGTSSVIYLTVKGYQAQ